MESPLKRLKSHDLMSESEQDHINTLPEELLFRIFSLVPHQQQVVREINELGMDTKTKTIKYSQLLLVCQHWKNIIEANFVFARTKIFHRKRTPTEYLIASKSSRKFQDINMLITLNELAELNCLKKILIQSQDVVQEVNITIGDDNKALKISIELIYSILKTCCHVTKLKLYLINVKLFGNPRNCKVNLLFSNLKKLEVIDFKRYSENQETILDQCLLLLEMPVLEIAQIYWSSENLSEQKNIFQQLEKFPGSLRKIYFGCASFDLTIILDSFFFRNVKWDTFKHVINLIGNVSKLELMNVDMNEITEDIILPNIRKLILQNCTVNPIRITTLSSIFPNVETLSIGVYQELHDAHKTIIRKMFPNLKDAKEYNVETGVSKIF